MPTLLCVFQKCTKFMLCTCILIWTNESAETVKLTSKQRKKGCKAEAKGNTAETVNEDDCAEIDIKKENQ